jgi:hypothetical protein
MPVRRITTFRIDEDLLDGLREIQERDGIPVAEQVRRAIRQWLETRGTARTIRRQLNRKTR